MFTIRHNDILGGGSLTIYHYRDRAVIGKEATKLGLKKGAVYVAKQAGAIAATQAGMTFVLRPLAEKYNSSNLERMRSGL